METISRDIAKLESQYKEARNRYREIKRDLQLQQVYVAHASEAVHVLETVASEVQKNWYLQLGEVVSRCLNTVFSDQAYQFKLEFRQQANRTEVSFYMERDGERYTPMDSTGGGVVDVASFALRMAAMMLNVSNQRMVLVMDEPFRFVSVEYRERVRVLLEQLAKEFKVQLIMVTHMEELETGKVVLL